MNLTISAMTTGRILVSTPFDSGFGDAMLSLTPEAARALAVVFRADRFERALNCQVNMYHHIWFNHLEAEVMSAIAAWLDRVATAVQEKRTLEVEVDLLSGQVSEPDIDDYNISYPGGLHPLNKEAGL